jgi:hypothetical protein
MTGPHVFVHRPLVRKLQRPRSKSLPLRELIGRPSPKCRICDKPAGNSIHVTQDPSGDAIYPPACLPGAAYNPDDIIPTLDGLWNGPR